MWTSTQDEYYIQVLLADMLGMREGNIRVINPYTGGGFGSKFELDSAQFCAALLSQKICRPIKIVLSREEEFTATKRRKFTQLALTFMKEHEQMDRSCRFDVVAIDWPELGERPEIRHYVNAFPAAGGYEAY